MSSLYGLVVCGGKSTRMGMDKSMLNYHGQPQRYHVYDILLPLCDQVLISCNEEQATTIPDRYAVLIDKEPYKNIGPISALLNAFTLYPNASFLAVGCDYPMLSTEHLKNLIKVSLQTKNCTASYNILDCIYEPLIAVYQNNIKEYLEKHFKLNNFSLRRFLEDINAEIVIPDKQIQIMSIDTQQDRDIIMAQLRR